MWNFITIQNAENKLLQVLAINGTLFINSPALKFRVHYRRWKERKSWEVVKSALKCWLLDMIECGHYIHEVTAVTLAYIRPTQD